MELKTCRPNQFAALGKLLPLNFAQISINKLPFLEKSVLNKLFF